MDVSLCTAAKPHWLMDSGATHHITPHESNFDTYTPTKGIVCLGDKSTIDQVGVGSVTIKTPEGIKITLSNVLHLPSVQTCFLSTGALADKGADTTFSKRGFKTILNGCCVATGY